MTSKKPYNSKQSIQIQGAYDHLKTEVRNKKKNYSSSTGMTKYFIVFTIIFGLLLGLGAFSPDFGLFRSSDTPVTENNASNDGAIISAVLYSSPTCECCHNYVNILNDNGFEVVQQKTDDYMNIKVENNIPEDQQSCHTMIIGNYFIEGHIPISTILKLLKNKTNTDGIALAGMPSGSPGMGGEKSQVWDIYAISNGIATSVFDSL